MKRNERAHGFTMVETIVVMAIIAILAGLIIVGVLAVQEGALRRQAETEAATLLQAFQEYRSMYGKWPLQNPDPGDILHTNNAPVVDALAIDAAENPRKHRFLRLHALQLARDTDGNILDPWGEPYAMAFDMNGDGKLDLVVPVPLTNVSAAVLSRGGKQGDYTIGAP